MPRFRSVISASWVVAALALNLGPADAQLPPVSPEQERNGLLVKSVTFAPEDVELGRGDTLTITATFRDAAGEPVEGVQALLVSRGSQLRPSFAIATNARFTGAEPGMASLMALVRVPSDSGAFQGLGGVKQIGTVNVLVKEWPAARIAIADSPFRPYAGTAYKLDGKVFTDHDTEHYSATISWRSETPSVATITPGGVLMPTRPGEAIFVASTENNITERLTLQVIENPVQQLEITPRSATARTGDVVQFDVRPLDRRGRIVEDIALSYSVFGLDSAGAEVFEDGAFVAETPGAFRVVASLGSMAADAVVEVTPRPNTSEIELVKHAAVPHVATSDLWVFEGRDGRDYAYTGTHAQGGGERMFVWDVTDPASVVLKDSVVVDARVVNDVKVSADAAWAVITREGASTRRNGIVVLDLADPAHPTILAELTDSLTAGIHNTWINGSIVYAVNDGTSAMHIIDLSDPANPRHAGRWEIRPGETDKSLHDVWSDGRYAYLSYWDDGLVVLDVGAGTHGGTPTNPTFVSQFSYGMGNTHVAWRSGDYVFLGDEIGTADGMRGYIHVVDVSDIEQPKEVGKYDVPEAGAHNIWVEDDLLYVAYYQGGLRIIDISGSLRGNLYRQGREIAHYRTAAQEGQGITTNSPMAWGPQPFKGNIFVSDMNSGLWVIKHKRDRALTP